MDELFSVSDTNPVYSLLKVWDNHLYTTHPPFNYVIQWFWYNIFGYNDFQARLPPMLFGVISIIAIYFLAKELIDKKTGLIAAFLISINLFHIEYSQEARSYSLLCLMSIISFYFFVKSINSSKPVYYIFHILSGTLLIYTHYTGIFLLTSQILIILGLFILSEIKLKKTIYFAGLYFVISVFCTPLIQSIIWLKKSHISIDGIPSTETIAQYFSYYFGSQFLLTSIMLLLLITAIAYFSNGDDNESLMKSRRLTAFVLFGWIIIGITLPYLRSINGTTNFHIRYTISIFPAFIILIAIGLTCLKSKSFQFVTIIFIALLTSINIIYEKKYYKDYLWKADFRSLSKEIIIKNKNNYPIWDLGSDGFADPIEPWAFYFRQNGSNPRFIDLNADSNTFLNENGVWLPYVKYSRGIEDKIQLLKRNGFELKFDITQFHICRGVLMVKK